MHNEYHVNIHTKRRVIALLMLLVIIGGIVLYGKPRNAVQPTFDTAPLVKGPTTPPPHQQ